MNTKSQCLTLIAGNLSFGVTWQAILYQLIILSSNFAKTHGLRHGAIPISILCVHCSLLQPCCDLSLSYLVLHVTPIMMVVSATASTLKGNTVLTELDLWNCDIDAEGTSQLAEALCGITTLRVLNLSFNNVDTQGARHLGKLSCLLCDYLWLLKMSGMTVHKEVIVISITWIDLEPRVHMTSSLFQWRKENE